ncbi:hypothetical protein Glove_117g489 [Diversispora epigaea]|uniref:Uncharacterized protein n=1 Tax=Diversispora epigaea TaxID=1348612 RepID=A0A397J550_9GLOM|nr:hypothetical protein Glove_117g489 [Diversispora epigaea]
MLPHYVTLDNLFYTKTDNDDDDDDNNKEYIEQLFNWINKLCKERTIEDTGLSKVLLDDDGDSDDDGDDDDDEREGGRDGKYEKGGRGKGRGRGEINDSNNDDDNTVSVLIILFLDIICEEMDENFRSREHFIEVIKLAGLKFTKQIYNFLTAFYQRIIIMITSCTCLDNRTGQQCLHR